MIILAPRKMCKVIDSMAQVEDVTLEGRHTSFKAGVKEEEDRVDFE